MGTLLGDGSLEKDGNGTRISFYQSGAHADYLIWLYTQIYNLGYCKSTVPIITSRANNFNDQVRYIIRFRTYTYSSFNWLYFAFYPNASLGSSKNSKNTKRYVNGVKVIPSFIGDYLTPLALAIWIMDDGTHHLNKGVRLCTNSFSTQDLYLLQEVLESKFDLKTSLHKTGNRDVEKEAYGLYIWKESMGQLTDLVLPYMHYSMYYK